MTNGSCFDFWKAEKIILFTKTYRPVLGFNKLPVQWMLRDRHSHLLPGLRISGGVLHLRKLLHGVHTDCLPFI